MQSPERFELVLKELDSIELELARLTTQLEGTKLEFGQWTADWPGNIRDSFESREAVLERYKVHLADYQSRLVTLKMALDNQLHVQYAKFISDEIQRTSESYQSTLRRIGDILSEEEALSVQARHHIMWAVRLARIPLGRADPLRLQSPDSPGIVQAHQVSPDLPRVSADESVLVIEQVADESDPAVLQDFFSGRETNAQIHLKISDSQRSHGYDARAYRLGPDSEGCEYVVAGVARWDQPFSTDPVFCFRQAVPTFWHAVEADSHWRPSSSSGFIENTLKTALSAAWTHAANNTHAIKLFGLTNKLPRWDCEAVVRAVDVGGWGGRPTDMAPTVVDAAIANVANIVLVGYPQHWQAPILCMFRLNEQFLAAYVEIRETKGSAQRKLAWFFQRSSGEHWDRLAGDVEPIPSILEELDTLSRLSS